MNHVVIIIFELAVLIFSVMMHEVSHGAVALMLGDDTAKRAGRLTLNPLKHIDPFGSIIFPLLLALPALFGGPLMIFGWAKPVPYNPIRLRNPQMGAGIIGAAGPISNLLLAAVFGLILRALVGAGVTGSILLLLDSIVYLNVVLAIFNLVPIPPLDGSNVLFAFLPDQFSELKHFLLRYGFTILLIFLFFGFGIIQPLIDGVYMLLSGNVVGF